MIYLKSKIFKHLTIYKFIKMTVAVSVGGSLGGLTAAIKLTEIFDTVYCFTGFNNYHESGNHGESRGLRTVNLSDELLDIVNEGWSYWKNIGLKGDLIHESIIHRFHETQTYIFNEKHNKLLSILDAISPKGRPRQSKQLNENTVLEDTGIYRIQEIVFQLKQIAIQKGVILSPVHVEEILHCNDCVSLHVVDNENEHYEIDCNKCVISVGNSIKNIKTNIAFLKPIPVWNEFTYFTVPNLYNHDGIWTWGTINYVNKDISKNRLGFYVMMENPELLKVACDTSFVRSRFELSEDNLNDYRKHKRNFILNHLSLKYTDYIHSECYYSVAPFVQQCGLVSIINSGGYGYCVPGFVLRAINNLSVPENTHYNIQLYATPRHDLSTYIG